MSKAFTRESDTEADDDDLEAGLPPLPAGARNYMTPEGHERLRSELQHLMTIERPQVVSVVSWAASNGDRSENGDYLYGKKRLRESDRRIRFLTRRLERAEVVDAAKQPDRERIYFGARVTYLDGQGTERTVRIVGIDEADPLQGDISWVAPVARALIKAREGDEVLLRTPAGLETLEVLEVSYPPA